MDPILAGTQLACVRALYVPELDLRHSYTHASRFYQH